MSNNKAEDFNENQIQLERRAGQADKEGRGRNAERPSQISGRGWRDVLWRVFAEVMEDRVMLIAAGATFYLLLALFPALAAFVSIYGFVADPQTVAEHISFLGGILPSGGLDLIRSQLNSLAAQNTSTLSFGFIFGLAVALWSANSGIKTLFEAMNIAYEETEKRGFIHLNLLALGFTLGAILIGIGLIISVGIVPAMLALVNLGGWTETLVRILRWPVLLIMVGIGITLIYRYGPSREKAKWRWATWGAFLSAVVWIAVSVGFSFYLENFANYNATYGALGAVIGLMMWTWISVIILIVGAELNAEMEHQTVKDTTTGAQQPMGARGATVADTLGGSADAANKQSRLDERKT
ncbi:YihY/virulence factor BrkB family protein [Mesorhizobium sp. M0045]|uniref:YihY/virulence factor BrkB family protein n=1 Tax=Mesorhizobium sp. M0045 TaxID=2956857 RepID=UPI0033354FCD